MKITDIKLRQLTGVMEVDGQWVEDRFVQPTDVYEEFRSKGRIGRSCQIDDTHLEVSSTYLQIETDDGISGVTGPLWPAVGYHVWLMKGMLIGQDPFATEYL